MPVSSEPATFGQFRQLVVFPIKKTNDIFDICRKCNTVAKIVNGEFISHGCKKKSRMWKKEQAKLEKEKVRRDILKQESRINRIRSEPVVSNHLRLMEY